VLIYFLECIVPGACKLVLTAGGSTCYEDYQIIYEALVPQYNKELKEIT
jgi:hypothetical protein